MKFVEAVITAVLYILLALAGIAASAWFVMIVVGMWHGERSAVPPISFKEAVYVVTLAAALCAPAARSNSK